MFRQKNILLVLFLFLFALPLSSSSQDANPPLPLDALAQLEDGLNPAVSIDIGGPRRGRFRISDNGWWMFFLHLRPLTDAPKLSVESVSNLMLGFWGEDMAVSAKLTGNNGTINEDDRTIYWAEAEFMNGAVRSRFLVWDDPMLERRIIADCNINLRRNTPDSLLTIVEKAIALSVLSTIGTNDDRRTGFLTQCREFEESKITISFPGDSRAGIYPGFDDSRSEYPPTHWTSIWILPVGIEWRYDLAWGPFLDTKPDKWIASLIPDSLIGSEQMQVDSLVIDSVYEDQWIGEASTSTHFVARKASGKWKLAAATWDHRGRTFRTIVACRIYDDWWGIPFDGVVETDTLNARMTRWINRIDTAPVWMGAIKK